MKITFTDTLNFSKPDPYETFEVYGFTFVLGKITAQYSLGGKEYLLADYNHLSGLWTTKNNTRFSSFEVH